MSPGSEFLDARNFLLAYRSDYEVARRDFSWPRVERFNWALDYFDVMAANNAELALLIVEEDGSECKRTFAELAFRSNQIANFLRALGVRRSDHTLVMLG